MLRKMKKPLVYFLITTLVMPAYLVIGSLSVSKAEAATVAPTVYASSDVIVAGPWQTSGSEKYTVGDQSSAYIEKDISAVASANPGVYQVEAQWNVWSDHTTNAIYQIEDSGAIIGTVSGINQKLLADQTSSATNGTLSGYYSLGSFSFTGTGSKIRLSGSSSDNGNVSFISFRISHSNVVPSTPLLTSPASNAYINSASQTLTWQAAVDTDEMPSTLNYDVVVDGAVKANVVETSYILDLTAMSESAHSWAIIAKDGTDSVTSETRNFTIDRTDPIINSVTGTAGTTGDIATITVNASDTNPTTAIISFDNGANWNPMSGSSGLFTYNYPVPASPTVPIPFIVEVGDDAGNFDTEVSAITVTDNDPAVILSSWVEPSPATTGEEALIKATVSDNIGVDKVRISINGGTPNLMDNLGSYQFAYAVPHSMSRVNYTITATDVSGLISTRDSYFDPSDNDHPQITALMPKDSISTTGESLTISATATDNIALSHATITYNGATHDMTGSGPAFSYLLPVPANSTSSIYYYVTVYDINGNTLSSDTYKITVSDNDNPTGTISINSGAAYTNTSAVTLNLTATDNIEVKEMSFRNGAASLWSGWQPYSVSASWTLPDAQGATVVQARFRDAANNISDTVAASIILDTIAPAVTVSSPENGLITSNPTQTFTASASEDATACWLDMADNDFEGDTSSWTTSGNVSVVDNIYHSAGHSLQLQTTNDEFASDNYAYMTVNLADSGPIYLNAWIKQSTTDGFYWDQQRIYLTDANGTFITNLLNTLATSDWHNVSYDLSAYAGQTVRVYFSVHDDGWDDPSRMWVDDVAVSQSASGQNYSMTQDATGIWTATVNDIAEGLNTYVVRCSDAGGNVGVSETRSLTIDTTAPSISGEASSSITTTSATITWNTNKASTSRVVYDTVSHSDISGYAAGSNYGYAYSTAENQLLVTSHVVTITGLNPNAVYYFRVVSHGSPESVGAERSFQTSAAATSSTETTIVEAVATTTTPVENAVTSSDNSAATSNVQQSTSDGSDDQGKIKGDEDTSTSEEESGVNWTPWIILFILIILAGAATGGYFYWFAGDDEIEKEEAPKAPVKKTNNNTAKTKSNNKTSSKTTKSSSKKSKRW